MEDLKSFSVSETHEVQPRVDELKDALKWITDQFEKVLAGERAGNVVESLSYAKSLLK
ncbi:hypothetical protein HUB98_05760 [Paenibacillus barcinonensis]|uniref:Uncharacterized protein n=1 Tax=Paenibacillus barcinonensis TaxID=198119 RepID=A0A2V4W863_PAEBA|nr:hypothetical protein [Paenibacillus barcinonensis]PYE51503.1 hypothetical protein DFQ00_102297 [Paenibacillus barcinonensis]QKS55886.1 hypothetical protein HUB98_05760 [Paenibacillus barcinonensis]